MECFYEDDKVTLKGQRMGESKWIIQEQEKRLDILLVEMLCKFQPYGVCEKR